MDKEKEFTDEIKDDVTDEDITKETTETTTTTNQKTLPDDWEPMVNKMVSDRTTEQIVKLAEANPEFADYILEKTGIDVSPNRPKQKEKDKEETNTYFDEVEALKDKIKQMEEREKERETKAVWDNVNKSIDREMKADQFFTSLPKEFKDEVKSSIFQNYMINGNGKDISTFIENTKKSLMGFSKATISNYLKDKEAIQNTPVDPKVIMNNIKDKFKDKEFSPASKKGRESGLLGQMADEYWDKQLKHLSK